MSYMPSECNQNGILEELEFLRSENQRIHAENEFFRSILFASVTPSTASIVNALRHASDISRESERIRDGSELDKIKKLCTALEAENAALRMRLSNED